MSRPVPSRISAPLGLALLAACAVAALVEIAAASPTRRIDGDASVATVTVLAGEVSLASARGPLQVVRTSQALRAGDFVHAPEGSVALITFVDGTEARVERGVVTLDARAPGPDPAAALGRRAVSVVRLLGGTFVERPASGGAAIGAVRG